MDTILNLQLSNVTRENFEMMDCQPHEALTIIISLVEKMYNYIIATRGVFELGPITYKAIEHYLRVSSTPFKHLLVNSKRNYAHCSNPFLF
jgi:hypothetical protein